MKKWLDTPWIYAYVAIVGGALTALVTAISGNGVDWPEVSNFTTSSPGMTHAKDRAMSSRVIS